MKENKLSPAMQQYVDMKAECPDALLLYRLGDFYECFFEDAKIMARTLDLVLTKRGTDADGIDIPMCGIPWHAMESYVGRLVRGGHSVAFAEQMETPEEAKARGRKQIERKIVRVLTPGTLTDENLLSPSRSNFLVAVAPRPDSVFDIAGCDISTGEFFVGELSGNLFDELTRLNPAEIIYPESASEIPEIMRVRAAFKTTHIYDRLYARENITETVKTIFGIENTSVNIAVHLLAGYLESTQRGAKMAFRAPYRLGEGKRLLIDAATWKSLEIDDTLSGHGATLLDVIDKTKTAAGARKLRAYLRELSGDVSVIQKRARHIGHLLLNSDVFNSVRALLGKVSDIGRSVSRLSANRGTPRDLKGVAEFLTLLPQIKSVGARLDSELASHFNQIKTHDNLAYELRSALMDNLPAFFREGNIIRSGFNSALDNMNALAHGAREVIAGLQAEYVKATEIATLKIKYNNILGYHIEVPSKAADKLFADSGNFIHRQTMKDNVRFTTTRLIELDNEVRGAADRASAIEAEIVAELIEKILQESDDLNATANLLSDVDVWAALAECAAEYGWVRPTVTDDRTFDVSGGRHPVVEKILRARADNFVKNDCCLGTGAEKYRKAKFVRDENADAQSANNSDDTKSIALLTGPNMAGKSTYLRQNALIVVLAHLGSFVPADSANVGLCDQLFSRVGASDNLAAGQSTFMVEMTETANILNRATDKSFIIFDEIGRGTATFDGLSIAWAVLEFLNKLGPRALFATHYHELTALADDAAGKKLEYVKNLTVSVAEDNGEIIFMHKITPGVAASSYGIHVAKMAGMPETVVARAEEVLAGLESQENNCGVAGVASKKQETVIPSSAIPHTAPIQRVSEPLPLKKSQMTLF
ncbi:MAG: DNA mismatch repair protein MutS [Alphaproteobacteria bacterium]|nr:DNA mismatch repair protein MutS [Alphaproteobacteria bacterium]